MGLDNSARNLICSSQIMGQTQYSKWAISNLQAREAQTLLVKSSTVRFLLLFLLLPATSAIARAENANRAPMDPTERRPWPDLPTEILSMIGDRLDTRMDVLRFRSVCSSFRSSIPAPPRREALRFPLRIQPDLFLRASTVYALETPDGAGGSGRARWLLMLEESSEPGRMRILSLYSQRRITHMLHKFPKVLDSRQSRMVEICRQYTLDGTTGGLFQGVQKVVMHPDGVGSDSDQCSVYFIDEGGQLGCWKYGDENWSYLADDCRRGYDYSDIVVYDGKVWVVDSFGEILWIHRSFRPQSCLLPVCDIGGRCHHRFHGFSKHFVVSGGDLYVVCRYISSSRCRSGSPAKTSHFVVFRLDQRRARWEEVRSLGDLAFFLCNRCSFAVPARELDGHGEGNCIYRAEIYCANFEVFNLADRSLKWPDYSDFLVGLLR